MNQTMLFPEEKKDVKSAPAAKKNEHTNTNLTITSTAEEQAKTWIAAKEANKENHAYIAIDYACQIDLDRTVEGIAFEEEVWHKFKPNGLNSTGSIRPRDAFAASKERFEEFVDYIFGFKTNLLKTPYAEHNGSKNFEHWLRDIKAENIKIFYAEKARELVLRCTGKDMAEISKQLDAMSEHHAAEEDFQRLKKYELLEEIVEKTGKKLEEMKEEIAECFDIDSSTVMFKKKSERKELPLDYEEKDWNKTADEFKTLEKEYESAEKEREEMLELMRKNWF